ncbi:MAG: LacI family transcriptional regulator, partial [Saprospiraceae bacterium]
ALTENGLTVNPALIKQLQFSHNKDLIKEAIEEILEAGADGLLFTTGKLTIIGIGCLKEFGASIPDDISVISFDDTDAYKVAYTPISAIVQPLELMSIEAVRILVDMIENGQNNGQVENIMLDVNFIYRESCV